MNGFTSRILHAVDKRRDANSALRFPVYECSAFEFDSAEDIAGSFDGSKPAHAYSRVSNPTVEALEQRILAISGGHGCIACASGMAAITNVVLTLCETGSNIVASRYLFGNTVSLFEKTLGPWGLEIRWVDPVNPGEVAAAIDNKTAFVFAETISNPQIVVADVEKIASVCHERNVPFCLDNSLATSYLIKSADFGADIEIVSAAKYISGGGTSVGGLIIDNGIYDWNRFPKLKQNSEKWGKDAFVRTIRSIAARNIGACLSPNSAYLQMLGLETLSLRIDRSSSNALAVAKFLESHKNVYKVNYPGLERSPFHTVSVKQFRNGLCGGLMSFELSVNVNPAEFINRLKVIKRSSNFNDNKSLIIHPASTLFCEYSGEMLEKMGISGQLIRLSIGIEDLEDLVWDLEQALGWQ